MTFWKTYYHLVWATKDRLPLITENIEVELYNYIRNKCSELNCPFPSIGGINDHIHLVVSIPPSLSIADLVRRVKGSSSHFVNQSQLNPEFKFAWQHEYGVFSLGGKQLDRAVSYVKNQKQHHAQGSIVRFLEPEIVTSE
jgi:putative transposase